MAKQVKPKGEVKFGGDKKDNKDKSSKSSNNSAKSKASTRVNKVGGAILGIVILAVLGLCAVVFILSRLPYRTDPNLPIPTLEELDEYTDENEIDVSGEVTPGEKIALYKNGKMQDGNVEADDDGKFTFEGVELEDEDDYSFEAVTVRGRIFKKRSEKSNEVNTTVDRTAPSPDINLDYEETNTSGEATIKGEAEPDAYIVLEKEGAEYETQADEKGKFSFEDITLESGENEFTVKIRDMAGNEVEADDKVTITYDGGDLNGPGATDEAGTGQLPESAGELDRAIEILTGNKVMLVLGIAALAVFAASSMGVVAFNSRKNS